MASIRFLAALVAGLFLLTVSAPSSAQTNRAKGAANIDLPARLKEVLQDPQLTETLLKTGQRVAAVCANCHGEGGNSLKPDIPNLAGQNPAYLIEQLRRFTDGRRRFEFMEGMIKAMSNDEKIATVLFYAAQKVTHKPASNAALVARGKDYFNKVCWTCHGNDGRGNEKIARIAGQQADYMRATLTNYRNGTGARTEPQMAAITRGMSDADIAAVVTYVGAMQ